MVYEVIIFTLSPVAADVCLAACPAEVRLIFQPVITVRICDPPYLVYAERLDEIIDRDWVDASRLPRLRRAYYESQGQRSRNGSVISLSRILTAVDVQPWFGREADDRLNSSNSMAISKQFLLNIYSDRDIHHLFT
jgi:hypothetical protein